MRLISPAKRTNRGTGLPPQYLIDPYLRSDEIRCCRHCGKYAENLIKTGRRSYAHLECFEAKYGKLMNLKKVNAD